MKLLASQTAEFYRAKGQSVMENLLQAHHDFQAVYAANDEMMLGALEAMSANGVPPGRVITVGYDVIPDAARSIKEGRLTASVEQFPGQQARRALRLLVAKIRDGQPPPRREIYLTPVVIDKNNLDRAEAQGLIGHDAGLGEGLEEVRHLDRPGSGLRRAGDPFSPFPQARTTS